MSVVCFLVNLTVRSYFHIVHVLSDIQVVVNEEY
jgi:hypothetical protein